MKWYHRQDSILSLISERNDVPASMLDQFVAGSNIAHAMLAIGQKDMAEVNRAIVNYKKTERSKTVGGQIDGAELLLHAERYAEAADAYALLDRFFVEYNLEASLDNLIQYMVGKFRANYKAGRRDSALAVAAYIAEHLDSAFIKQKKSDAAELATVYQTQQKDAEIARQQISLSRQRWIGTMVALVLLLVFFVIYTEYRRRAAKRLGAAHVKLQEAYNQLEETTAAKERIESELRIARDIQMSMVPGVFPKYKGLDMYAEMTPAKEVGGDLYGYVMQGDKLYFCVGDVSGKGVPASLFMAQSARLFRTLAAEGMMPANIATRMNNELVEGNDSNMFVTMFIGLLHLDTGRLDFCNCGHNPPVLDGQFLEMKYTNQMIGFWEGKPFYGETIDDIRGHQLLIYTDGLNEAENQQTELLGNERLLELMAATKSLDSRQVINMLVKAVEQDRAGANPNDDLTLMCIKFE
jgi:serine phosphatase RsbU (regulator of sigma subunit)